MDFKLPFLHKHYLLYDKYEKQDAFCDECNQTIVGMALACERCKFWLHQSCAQRKLPCMISHPLHSRLTLQLKFGMWRFICGKCFTLSSGYGYSNKDNSFSLDVICAFSTNDQTLNEESERSEGIANKIRHFWHEHSLTLFNYRKVSKYEYCCSWCDKPLSGMSYGCLDGCFRLQFFLHRFCLYTIPNKILEHPFHPSHPLVLNYISVLHCSACEQHALEQFVYSSSRKRGGFIYYCERCDFQLHVLCAKLKPTLRHECHEHYLAYVVDKGGWKSSQCQKCNLCRHMKRSAIYRCVQCKCNFHFGCLIPSTVKHEYHIHSLTVTKEFKEDYSGEYYCDICEKQRNPDHHIYCCKKCLYTAHIECALDKAVDAKSSQLLTSALKHGESQQLIKDLKHNHPLIFKEIIGKDEKLLCNACQLEVSDEAYVSERESCRYYLHKTCGESPYELLHPLHSLGHVLILLTKIDSDPRGSICDKCGDISRGFMYHCFLCNFKLDIKCVVVTSSKLVNQQEGIKEIERPSTATITTLSHFCHNHDLLLANSGAPHQTSIIICELCSLNTPGPVYCCRECMFYVHESCLGKLQREIQIPSHPLHALHPFFIRLKHPFFRCCLACKYGLGRFGYECIHCRIYLHISCAAFLKHPLRSESHLHNLYLFNRDRLKAINRLKFSMCTKCNNSLEDTSIYRCIECDCNFHLQCVGISYRFKSKCHIHPLTLKDGFVEDDSREYYCDVCEEKRDPEDDVYYCQECDRMFIAHINCAVIEVEEVLQQYGPAPYSPPYN